MKARKLASDEINGERPIKLQWGRANEGAETSQLYFSCAIVETLQWGRANEGAETFARAFHNLVHSDKLQWGRANEGAETYVLATCWTAAGCQDVFERC